ncbi:MAG: inositol monophosphatase family protein [Ferrimicrobium sp.]
MKNLVDADALKYVSLGISVTSGCLDAVPHGTDWSMTGEVRGQHVGDVVADAIAMPLLIAAGVNVFSEESDRIDQESQVTAVIDPIDGSTNASRGIPYWASSLCFVDNEGPWVAVVQTAPMRETFVGVRGQGAYLNGVRIHCSGRSSLQGGLVFVNGFPRRRLAWGQIRAVGSAATELCYLACGRGDGLIDFSEGLAVWDYFGGALVVQEAGGTVLREDGRDIGETIDRTRHRIVGGSSFGIADQLRGALIALQPKV